MEWFWRCGRFSPAGFSFPDIYRVPAVAFPGRRIRMGAFLVPLLSFEPKPSGLPGGSIAFLPRVSLYVPFSLVLTHMHDMVVVRKGKME